MPSLTPTRNSKATNLYLNSSRMHRSSEPIPQGTKASSPAPPFKRPQILSNGDHKALNRATLGGLGRDPGFRKDAWSHVPLLPRQQARRGEICDGFAERSASKNSRFWVEVRDSWGSGHRRNPQSRATVAGILHVWGVGNHESSV